jgi:hypothetical protein
MRIGETLKKAAGLFVEIEEKPEEKEWSVMDAPTPSPTPDPIPTPAPTPTPAPRTVEQIVRESPGPNLDQIHPTATPSQPVIDPSGKVDFAAIYQLANLPSSPFTAEQVLEVLASLPPELPLEAKRTTLKVTLGAMAKTMGVTSETVVADASRKLAALAGYAESYVKQANEYIAKSEQEIQALQAQIEERRRGINDAVKKQSQMVDACTAESDRLDDVLEFFSLDVGPSKYAG